MARRLTATNTAVEIFLLHVMEAELEVAEIAAWLEPHSLLLEG